MSDKLVGLTASTNCWITAIDFGETKADLHNETVLQEITIAMKLIILYQQSTSERVFQTSKKPCFAILIQLNEVTRYTKTTY